MNDRKIARDGAAKALRVLVVEDSPRDAELVAREIRSGGFDLTWKRVDTEAAMKAALNAESWDAVVSDYSMPHFDGLGALRVLQDSGLDIPFIIVSGTIGEETAVAAMQAGAHDYLMKNNIARLVPAIERELRDAASRLEYQWTKDRVERLARFPSENPNPVLRISALGILEHANAAAELILPSLGITKIGGAVNAEWQAHIDEAITNAQPTNIEFQAEGRTFDATLAPVTDHGYVNVYTHDITEQRQTEAQFRQAQKMESVGRLAGGVAHDFNNMLQVILGYTELALGKSDPSEPLFADLQEIKNAGARSGDLTRQLLAFAREQPIEPVILNLNDEISKILNMLQRLLREEVVMVWHPGTPLHSVKLDPSQIDQILVNLCVNAQDAIAGDGKIIIETANATLDKTYCAGHIDAVPGDYIVLTVSDTGCGMDRETQEKLFEPFFTTKEVGKGTGLGLPTVYGIVKQNGGFITVYSEPGHGTTFKIHLPKTDAALPDETENDTPPLPEFHGETVLLVEDEPTLRNLYSQFLKVLGYTALTAEDSQEALAMSSKHGSDIHLLLTDVVMPGMNGKELADAIRSSNPSIKVLFMSGYTADIIVDHDVFEQNVAFIAKPFSCNDLARKVHDVLKKHD